MPAPRNAFERYMTDISSYPRITPRREAELSRTIHESDDPGEVEAATNELIHANLRLVIHCLKGFEGFLASPAVRITRMDLVAEGNIGLMKAATSFNADFAKNDAGGSVTSAAIRFSTYACRCIQSHMQRALKRSHFIHIPEHHFTHRSEMRALRLEHNDSISDELLGQKLDVSLEVVERLKQSARSSTCMLEDLAAHDAEGGGWHDFIPDDSAVCPARETGRNDLRNFLLTEMQSLPPRTMKMLSLLYLDEHSPSLRDLARTYNISSERCRQVCMQGLHHLRRQLAGRMQQIEPDMPASAGVCTA